MLIPKHISFIADGNRRWAKSRGLPAFVGHRRGSDTILDITEKAASIGIGYVSFFVWSNDNDIKRSTQEKEHIVDVIWKFCSDKIDRLNAIGARVRVFGERPSFVDDKTYSLVTKLERDTRNNTKIVLCLYFGYSGRDEIIHAIKECVRDVSDKKINLHDIDSSVVKSKLYDCDIPYPEILVRTSGERRVSNFTLWQLAYSEFFFVDKYWPDFSGDDLNYIIEQFQNRERRYGV